MMVPPSLTAPQGVRWRERHPKRKASPANSDGKREAASGNLRWTGTRVAKKEADVICR